jgi:hypothetical protein
LSEPPSGASQVSANRVSVRHVSGDRRSRITEPADRAARASAGTELARPPRCKAARAKATGRAAGRSSGTAPQDVSSDMIGWMSCSAGSLSEIRASKARTSRNVASVRSM